MYKDSETLQVPTFKDELNNLFSFYGRIKWLIVDKKGCLSDKSLEHINKMGWTTVMDGLYESPMITSFEQHTNEILNLINVIKKDLDDTLQIVATYGSFPGSNFK